MFIFRLAEDFAIFHALCPFKIVDTVHILDIRSQALQPISDFARDRAAFQTAHLLEIGELGYFNPSTLQPINPILRQENFIPVSAINQMNIEYLKEKLYESALSGKVSLENTIVTNARHYEALQHAHDSLKAALQGLNDNITGDFLALDIRRALAYLGEITGEVGVEDLLENIFSRFCIGK